MSTASKNLKQLTLKSIDELDYGKAFIAFQHCLDRAIHDCRNRPGDKRKRVVELKLEVTPVPIFEGNEIHLERIKGIFKTLCKLPVIETQPVDFGVSSKGELLFNPDSPGDHQQQTCLDDEEE